MLKALGQIYGPPPAWPKQEMQRPRTQYDSRPPLMHLLLISDSLALNCWPPLVYGCHYQPFPTKNSCCFNDT